MTITISEEKNAGVETARTAFFAVAPEGKVSIGSTPGEALDALLAQRSSAEKTNGDSSFFIIRTGQGDAFFSNEQNARLESLRSRQKTGELSPVESQELDDLLQEEIRASGERASFIAQQTAAAK